MGTKAETIGTIQGRGAHAVSARPTASTFWTAAVAVLAAAALILSVVALTLAADDRVVTGVAGGGVQGAAGSQASSWDAGKLQAMQGRLLAEGRVGDLAVRWDPGRLEAMEGRVLAG